MDNIRKKLRYQSWHRGCKETDDILGPFADYFLTICSSNQLEQFSKLLLEDDQDIWHWLTGKTACPKQYTDLLTAIQKFQHNRHQ